MKINLLSLGLLLILVSCVAPKVQRSTITTTIFPQTTHPTLAISPLSKSTTTPVLTDTATPTSKPSLTPISSLTPDLAATVIATQLPKLYASYPSPDGMWRVDIIIYNCVKTGKNDEAGWNENGYEQVILVNLSSGEEQIADNQLQFCGGLGAFGFSGRYWSPNSRYFYYTNARQGVPDGCGYWESPLLRIEVPLSANPEDLGIGARSPDAEQLATWNWPANTLTIWNIDDGEKLHFIALEADAEIGPITWFTDSRSLVYLLVDSWCPLSGKSYLVLVDIIKPEQTLLLESANPTFGSIEWVSPNVISLLDENGKEWNFDLRSHELTQNP